MMVDFFADMPEPEALVMAAIMFPALRRVVARFESGKLAKLFNDPDMLVQVAGEMLAAKIKSDEDGTVAGDETAKITG